jgi:hypothetical protein
VSVTRTVREIWADIKTDAVVRGEVAKPGRAAINKFRPLDKTFRGDDQVVLSQMTLAIMDLLAQIIPGDKSDLAAESIINTVCAAYELGRLRQRNHVDNLDIVHPLPMAGEVIVEDS